MNTMLLNYDPRCRLYNHVQTNGNTKWYVSYYLPNGERMRRPCSRKKSDATRMMHTKEAQLFAGKFDQKDMKKLDGFLPSNSRPLPITEAVDLYLKSASTGKTEKTKYNDITSIKKRFSFFGEIGIKYIQDVIPLNVQQLIDQLDEDGMSKSTLKNASAFVRKVYNWLIDVARIPDLQNPVVGIRFPKKGDVVRKRIPTIEEVKAILDVCKSYSDLRVTAAPIDKIVPFMICTGARLGEVLHAEWGDFDFDAGIWEIKHKPDCPTNSGLGWGPKWNMERDVLLFSQAIKILKSMPTRKTVGFVPIRDQNRKIVGHEKHPSDFVFSKREVMKCDDGVGEEVFSRVDSIKNSWKSLKEKAGVTDLQLKDLRTFFNSIVRSQFGFNSKESGTYIGNSEAVNKKHYDFAMISVMRDKMESNSFGELLGI
ncbi:MAG: tyrosine-type recombinase/integrase [Proteobacteria bacterium]|nr:tyrosine-type recombinase/integrase [Pseudomonadota bacterium]